MTKRRGLAAVAACATLSIAGIASATTDALSIARPIYASEPAKKPLMSLLDSVGAGSSLSSAGINVGGFIEGSWTHNFDSDAGQTNTGRVFDFESDDPTLNQVDVFIERPVTASGSKFDVGGRIEWIWGGDARLIHSNGVFDFDGPNDGPDEQFDPVQFYLQANLPVGNGVVVTAGKFVTLLGYETINPTTNPLYSHTYLFGFAIPFTNTGVMAKYVINNSWSVTGAVVRGWDQGFEDNNGDAVSFMGQVAWTSDKLDLIVNGITGPEQGGSDSDYRSVADFIAVYRAADNLQLIGNADIGYETDAGSDGDDATWFGAAGYAVYKWSDYVSLVGRAEFFNDNDGARGLGTTLYEFTGGLTIHPMPNDAYGSGLVIRPEIRWDIANDDVFDHGQDDQQVTVGGDIIYSF